MSFLQLPPELYIIITDFLYFPEVIYLRLTCRYFYNLIPALTHTKLLLAETSDYAVKKDLYTCRYCLRLRPAGKFADRMRSRRRSRNGRDVDKRFCIDCGLKSREGGEARYGPGAQITIDGCLFIICITCKQFERGAFDQRGRGMSECRSCQERRERERVMPFKVAYFCMRDDDEEHDPCSKRLPGQAQQVSDELRSGLITSNSIDQLSNALPYELNHRTGHNKFD